MLVRCLYASRTSEPAKDAALDTILKQSRRNNPRAGITGMLCHANGAYVQVIEGGRAEVSRLLATIMRDDRHSEVQILLYEEISERRFVNWVMGQVNISAVNPALLLKYSARPVLDPFAMPGAATMALLHEIAESGAIAHRHG
jgi:hypothetical protein